MSNDVSAFGLRIQLVASSTFPQGITLTQFADDTDPFDVPSVKIGDTAMGINGDLIKWNVANPVKLSIGVIPGSEDDINLAVLFEVNRVGRGKSSAKDNISVTGVYPDGRSVTMTNGMITDGMPGSSVASSGRVKSKTYQFAFEGLSRS